MLSYPDAWGDGESACASSSTSMEVLHEEHFLGVLKVLHEAKSGRLRTSKGVIDVRPKPGSHQDDECLFELELLDAPGAEFERFLELERAIELERTKIIELELDFGDAVFSLEGSAISLDSGTATVRRPRRLFSKGLASIVVSPGLVRLRWSVGKLTIRAEVLEISMDEILIEGSGPSLVPGRGRPAVIEFYEHDRAHVTEIRCHLDVLRGTPRPSCARLMLSTDEDHADLVRLYRVLRFPQLADRGALDPDQVVDLFERSRYLALRETDQAKPSDAWCCPDFAADLSIDTIYRADDGSLLGHVSVTRAYSKTWLGHQLATLKGHVESAACRHALYRHFACAPLLSDGEGSYLLGYYNRELRWHQLFFESFVDWVCDSDQSVIVEFDRFEPIPGDDIPSDEPPDNIVVEYLDPLDRAEAVALVASQLPDLAVRAFDIDVKHIQADALHPEYAARDLERGRHVLVLRESGRLAGVAMCETGSRHLSLFNLLNMGQIYVRKDRASRAGQKALLRAVRNFYVDRNAGEPVLVAPPGSFDHPDDVGLRREETMGCIIWSGQSLLQYQSFISYCFAKIGSRSLVELPSSNGPSTASPRHHQEAAPVFAPQ